MKPAFTAFFLALSAVAAHSASLITTDSATLGNWNGTYGGDGYQLMAYNPANITVQPTYVASIAPSGGANFTWFPGVLGVLPADPRFNNALENPAGVGANRTAGTYFSSGTGTYTINLNSPQTFQLSVYSLDWDLGRTTQTVTATDMNGMVTDNLTATSFDNGVWSVFNVSGDAANPVVITYTRATVNSVISGIAFDQIPEPSTGVLMLLAGSLYLRRRR